MNSAVGQRSLELDVLTSQSNHVNANGGAIPTSNVKISLEREGRGGRGGNHLSRFDSSPTQ